MTKIEKVVLYAILEVNGLHEDEFNKEDSLRSNGVESVDLIETLIEIEDHLHITGFGDIELDYIAVDVNEDNFYSLVKYVEGKVNE